jgi:hypothetical protein
MARSVVETAIVVRPTERNVLRLTRVSRPLLIAGIYIELGRVSIAGEIDRSSKSDNASNAQTHLHGLRQQPQIQARPGKERFPSVARGALHLCSCNRNSQGSGWRNMFPCVLKYKGPRHVPAGLKYPGQCSGRIPGVNPDDRHPCRGLPGTNRTTLRSPGGSAGDCSMWSRSDPAMNRRPDSRTMTPC